MGLKEMTRALLPAAMIALVPIAAQATPSTTYWAPSTASCQARGVPHVTYDSYFWKGPAAGSQGAPGYPIDTGLTAGFLPFNKLQGEAGFDFLLPSPNPLFLNVKLCTPESSLFKVFFLDKNLQPGGTKYLWTAQLDIDIPLGR